MSRKPCRDTVVICQIRGADGFPTGVENAILAGPLIKRTWCSRRCGLVFESLADDPLLSCRFYSVSRSTYVDQSRELIRRPTIKMSNEAERREWPDKKRSVRNCVCQADIRKRRYRGKAVAETI